MPQKNTVKLFFTNSYYHVYNRGVEKRDIFMDQEDYKTFLFFLKKYLSPPRKGKISINKLHEEIKLIAYCLMPNHFHLLLKQKSKDAITRLLRRVATNYVVYFNKKYKRVGSLFQGVYKAVLIDTTEQFIHLSRYIHLNPKNYQDYPYSSYTSFVDQNNRKWLHPKEILEIFKENNNKAPKQAYKHFVQSFLKDDVTTIKQVLLD